MRNPLELSRQNEKERMKSVTLRMTNFGGSMHLFILARQHSIIYEVSLYSIMRVSNSIAPFIASEYIAASIREYDDRYLRNSN